MQEVNLGKAEASGLTVMEVKDAVQSSNVVMILLPDEKQAKVYKSRWSRI